MNFKKLASKKTKNILLSCFVAFALSLSLNLITDGALKIDKNTNMISKIFLKCQKSINTDVYKTMAIFGFSYFLLREQKDEKRNIFKIMLALLFSLFTIFGYSYASIGNWDLVFANKIQFMKALIIGLGYFILFKAIISYVYDNVIPKISYKEIGNKVYNFIFEKHSFIIPLAIIILCWLPYLIINYPGILMPDSSNQIKQFFGIKLDDSNVTNSVNLIDENVNITNHHPVLHTVVLGLCLKFGRNIVNDNFGIFLYTFIQFLLLACSLSYSINFMKNIKTNNVIRIISLAIYSLLPIFPFYAIEITKDVPFTSLFIFYIIELFKIANNYKERKISIKRLALTIVISILICLLRNNGIYTILLSLPFVALLNKVNKKRILFATLIVFVLYESFLKILLPILKIPNTGIREMLSVPFQQTARYVKEYGDEVTEEEKEVIDKVLIYDTLAKRYKPERADNVKNKYNKDATSEDLKSYFKTWFKQFLKYPTVYIQAFVNNYYGYVYPNSKIVEYTIEDYIVEQDPRLNETNQFDYRYNKIFIEQRKNYNELLKLTRDVPVISLFSNIGLNSWMLLGMVGYFLYKKKYRYIVYVLPSISIALIYFVSPVNVYYRYALPNMFSMFIVISIFLNVIKKEGNVYEK